MSLLYILLALAVLLVMITVHEFGHYCAGKILGFKINEFAIGFGPAIYKRKKKNGELFSIRALPLGGFCAFEGEDEDGKESPDAFNNRPAWKRLIVLVSGVFFNFLFGILTAAIYLMFAGYTTPKITSTVKQSSIETIDLQQNDIILAIDGKSIEAYRTFSSMLSEYGENEEFVVTVDRNGEIIKVTAKKQKLNGFYYVSNESYFKDKLFDASGNAISIETFRDTIISIDSTTETGDAVGTGQAIKEYLSTIYKDKEHAGDAEYSYASDNKIFKDEKLVTNSDVIAITYAKEGVSLGVIQTNVKQSYGFFESILKAWPYCFYLCGLILSAFGGLFTGGTALSDMGGTVTAISQIAEISSYGASYFLLLLPLLAMNLAVFNILPIPALDGARAVFVIIEMIRRKPINRKIEAWIHTIGLFILLGFVIFFDVYHFAVAARLLIS